MKELEQTAAARGNDGGPRPVTPDTKRSEERVRTLPACALGTASTISARPGARPVLYENAHLKTVGKNVADQDI